MLVLAKACFSVQNSATTFRMTILSFVENYMNSLNQGVFDCTIIAQLPFG